MAVYSSCGSVDHASVSGNGDVPWWISNTNCIVGSSSLVCHPDVGSQREDVTRAAQSAEPSAVERRDVELANALRIAGDVDRDDTAVVDIELHDAAQLSARRPDESGEAVHDREARGTRAARERGGDVVRATHLAKRPHLQRRRV